MPWDIYDVSVPASAVAQDLAVGRVWRSGVAILRMGVYAPDAANPTNINFYMGRALIIGPNGRKNGVQWAAGNDDKTLAQIAQQNVPGETNVLNVANAAVSAQTFTVVVEYE